MTKRRLRRLPRALAEPVVNWPMMSRYHRKVLRQFKGPVDLWDYMDALGDPDERVKHFTQRGLK